MCFKSVFVVAGFSEDYFGLCLLHVVVVVVNRFFIPRIVVFVVARLTTIKMHIHLFKCHHVLKLRA